MCVYLSIYIYIYIGLFHNGDVPQYVHFSQGVPHTQVNPYATNDMCLVATYSHVWCIYLASTYISTEIQIVSTGGMDTLMSTTHEPCDDPDFFGQRITKLANI